MLPSSADADITVGGIAGVSAKVGGVIEVGASVEASLSGDLSFAANEYGGFMSFSDWLISIGNISGKRLWHDVA